MTNGAFTFLSESTLTFNLH